jgi:tetratricopeptide (TPR) repeat protein
LRSGDRATAYDTVARAVHDYLAAKLDLAPGGVSAQSVGAALRARRLAPAIVDDIDAFFAACDSARFAPRANDDGDMQRTFAHAEAIVRALERQRRLGPIAAAVLAAVAGLGTLHGFSGGSVAPAAALNAPSGATADSPNTIFFRGNTLYGEERYAEAAAEYERILAAGRESGNLYFNLGNAYFRAGDVGRALLNYERARRLIPRDPDLLANLGYARTRAGIGEDRPRLVHLAFPLADRANTDELLLVTSVAYTALMLLLVVRRLVPRARRGLSMGVFAVGAVLVIVLASTAYRVRTVELPRYAVVIARGDTSVRFEPSTTGTTYFQAKPGTLLRVLAERETWAQVARSDGTRGWIEREAVAAL